VDDPELVVVRSRQEFEALPVHSDRLAYEGMLGHINRDNEVWPLPGFCQACGAAVVFEGNWAWSDGTVPNLRECLVCPTCGLNNRQRFVANFVRSAQDGRVYLFEQVTWFYRWAQEHLSDMVGSEYLGPGIAGGTVINGIRHEDVAGLSFRDDSLRMIVSQDVFEHVPDIEAALRETHRVLEPGGRMVFSVPFYYWRDVTVRRAEIVDGQVVELLPPEYHGNPTDAEAGSLVFYEHSWDILDRCREAGFADAYVLGYWSALYGYLGGGRQLVFVAEAA
jgi:hypothetical protein